MLYYDTTYLNVHFKLSMKTIGAEFVEKSSCEGHVTWLCNTFVRHCMSNLCIHKDMKYTTQAL